MIQIEIGIAIEIERVCHSVQMNPAVYGFDYDPEERNPNKRMHWTLILRAGELGRGYFLDSSSGSRILI